MAGPAEGEKTTTTDLYGTFLVPGPLKVLLQQQQFSLAATHTNMN